MKTYIQLICMALIVVINYSCEKKIPVIEHSISGVLYLDHTLQPAANYEVRLQYNSLIYSLRDTKILDECITDENGNFYLKYVKIAGAGELEIENNGGTALLTEIPVNEDIEFSFPIKPFLNLEYKLNYNRPLEDGDTVFFDASYIINRNAISGIVYIEQLQNYYFMLTKNYQPYSISAVGSSNNIYNQMINYEDISYDCLPYRGRAMGYGLNDMIKNQKIARSIYETTVPVDSSFSFYCFGPLTSPFSQEITININLPG